MYEYHHNLGMFHDMIVPIHGHFMASPSYNFIAFSWNFHWPIGLGKFMCISWYRFHCVFMGYSWFCDISWGMKCKVFMRRCNENSVKFLCFVSLINHGDFIGNVLVVIQHFQWLLCFKGISLVKPGDIDYGRELTAKFGVNISSKTLYR